jgi:hypothetical protein
MGINSKLPIVCQLEDILEVLFLDRSVHLLKPIEVLLYDTFLVLLVKQLPELSYSDIHGVVGGGLYEFKALP